MSRDTDNQSRGRQGHRPPQFNEFWSVAEQVGITQEIKDHVQQSAPSVFAVVQLNTMMRRWWITAWGLRFPDERVQVIQIANEHAEERRFDCNTVDYARWHYDVGEGIRAEIVDVAPDVPKSDDSAEIDR